ncbi:MAG: TonB-dependent receptor [Nevskiales bacterium]|nr:TonB-dependent receptor [Nevskiales bacterium]
MIQNPLCGAFRRTPMAIAVLLLGSVCGAACAEDDALDFLFADAPAESAPAPAHGAAVTQQQDTADSGPGPAAEDLSTIAVEPLSEPEPADAPAAPPPRQIEEIVVTAQKTAQSLHDVPISVSALDGDTLKQAGTFDAGGLENLVANVEIDIDPQAPVIGIRGFATETDNVGFESAVGLVFDDLALGRPEFIPDGLFDIERIEVLRGPQGTLFGKNTIAGVITFASAEPQDIVEGSLLATYGQPQQRRIEAAASVPLHDGLYSRLAGVYWDREGDIDNSTLGRKEGSLEQSAARVKLLAHPGDRWTLRLSSQYSTTSVDYAPWQLYAADPDVLRFAQRYDARTEDDPFDAHTAFDVPGYVERDSDLTRAVVDYDAGDLWGLRDVVGTAVVGHAAFDLATIIDIDVSPADLITTDFGVDYAQDSVELRGAAQADSLFGFGGDVQFVAGLYALQSDMSSHLDTIAGEDLLPFVASNAGLEALGLPTVNLIGELLDAFPPLPGVAINDRLLRGFEQETRSVAVFGQATWHVADPWSIIAGLRYGQDRKTADFDVERVGLGIVSAVVGASPFASSVRRTESDLSPKLGLQYDWSDAIASFLTWTRGFKGGGFNATAESEDNLEFEAERAQSWEAGIKSRLLDRTLTFNATVYRTDIDNLQVVDFTGFSYQVRNAAEARLQGVEADLRWLPPWEWLSVDLSAGWSRATYLSYPNAPPTEAQSAGNQETQDLTGKTLANAPTVSASLSPTLSLPLPWTRDVGLQWTVDFSYRGDQYSATDLDPRTFQDGYWLLGTRVVIGAEDGRWALVLAGQNLTDERALDLVMDHSVFANTYVAQQIPLRSWTASLQANWY